MASNKKKKLSQQHLASYVVTHYSAEKHGLWGIKPGILHQGYLFHCGLHVIHL